MGAYKRPGNSTLRFQPEESVDFTGFIAQAISTGTAMAKGKGGKGRYYPKPKAKPIFQPAPLAMSSMGIGDAEPTRNQKELHFSIYDWFDFALDDHPVYSYGFDPTQNFLGAITDPGVLGTGETKNRIKSVTLDMLSPSASFRASGTSGGSTGFDCTLPLVVSGIPVPDNFQDEAAGAIPNSIVGQQSTVVHPDVRRAWIKVAHWDWTSEFKDTQITPLYSNYEPDASKPKLFGLELFRMSLFDAATGLVCYALTGSTDNERLQFRVRIDLAAPIALTPTPVRYVARADAFAGDSVTLLGPLTDSKSPVQYQLQGLQNLL